MIDTNPLIDDCFLHDKDRMRHDEALDLLNTRLHSIAATETIRCDQAMGRVLAEDIVAPHKVPLHTNAAVDGFAFNSDDEHKQPVPVSGRIAAGALAPPKLQVGTAVRIFTGAPMPSGAQTVAMQEDCTVHDDAVQLPDGLNKGANCRMAGEDLQPGDSVVERGKLLAPADLAALASIGRFEIAACRKLKIALFSSGDEMRVPGPETSPLRPGEVYDANQPLLAALCRNLPVQLNSMGIIEDNADAVERTLKLAAQNYDVILTSGGASKGSEDHMVSTLDKLGKRHLWQLAIKPGRPMIFGQLARPSQSHDCLFFGLPGNPVAAMVCFLLYTRPALLKLAGSQWHSPVRFNVPAGFSIVNKKPDRREFLRGKLRQDCDGTLVVDKYERDGSGLISSLRNSDGLIEIPEHVTGLEKGDAVSFIPFSGFQ